MERFRDRAGTLGTSEAKRASAVEFVWHMQPLRLRSSPHGIRMELPVVRRASRSRWARSASASG